jgi:hypothetical protein
MPADARSAESEDPVTYKNVNGRSDSIEYQIFRPAPPVPDLLGGVILYVLCSAAVIAVGLLARSF